MPRNLAGVIDWTYAHGWNMDWAGWCEKYVNNAGDFNESFGSALKAGNASGDLNPDVGSAPAGACVYYDRVFIGAEDCGHVAFVAEPGDDPLLLMASSHVTGQIGMNVGTVRFSRYQNVGPRLRGWSLRHGSETLADIASLRASAPPPITKEDTMLYFALEGSTDGRIGKGYLYVQAGSGGHLRAVDSLEGSALLVSGQFIANWHGDDIRSLAARVGLLEYEAMLPGLKDTNGVPILGPGKLTGRVIFENNVPPDFPQASTTTSVSGPSRIPPPADPVFERVDAVPTPTNLRVITDRLGQEERIDPDIAG